jgi:Domain of unknown function (DUF4142)
MKACREDHAKASEELKAIVGNKEIEDNENDLEKFQREAAKDKDPDVNQFANKQVPVPKKHLEIAQATERQVKKV